MIPEGRRYLYCRWLVPIIAGLFAFLIAAPAFALTCGTSLNPLSVSATGVNFGTYDALSASAVNSGGTVIVACEFNLDALPAFSVSLSSGTANHFDPRTMASGASTLAYNLYTVASHTAVWGDGTSDTLTQGYDGLLVLGHVELTIYGAMPPGQFVSAGAYADTIIVTIEY